MRSHHGSVFLAQRARASSMERIPERGSLERVERRGALEGQVVDP